MNTLYDYYTKQGKSLPSLTERKKIAEQYGITNYSGSADQNNTLLSYLQGSGSSSSQSTPQITPDVDPYDDPNLPDSLRYGASMTRAQAQAKYDADLQSGGYDSTGVKTTQQKGTGAITPTKKLTAGNTSQLNPSSSTLAEILRNMINPNADEIDNAINSRVAKYKSESEQAIDENAIRKSFKDRIQGSIDAINQTYASMLGNARVRGQNNAGGTGGTAGTGSPAGTAGASGPNGEVVIAQLLTTV